MPVKEVTKLNATRHDNTGAAMSSKEASLPKTASTASARLVPTAKRGTKTASQKLGNIRGPDVVQDLVDHGAVMPAQRRAARRRIGPSKLQSDTGPM